MVTPIALDNMAGIVVGNCKCCGALLSTSMTAPGPWGDETLCRNCVGWAQRQQIVAYRTGGWSRLIAWESGGSPLGWMELERLPVRGA